MAELCARQGRMSEAVAIYRRLLEEYPQHAHSGAWRERLAELEARWQREGGTNVQAHEITVPMAPGVIAVVGRDDDGETAAVVAWAIGATDVPPMVELLLVTRGPDGMETTRRRLTLPASSGRLTLAAPGLHAVTAAIGFMNGSRFFPLARATGHGGGSASA